MNKKKLFSQEALEEMKESDFNIPAEEIKAGFAYGTEADE